MIFTPPKQALLLVSGKAVDLWKPSDSDLEMLKEAGTFSSDYTESTTSLAQFNTLCAEL